MSRESDQFIKGITKYAESLSDWRKNFGAHPENQLERLLDPYKSDKIICCSLIDLKNLTTIYSKGTSRLFGIPETDFSTDQFISFIHPSFQWLYFAKALALLGAINQFKSFVNLEVPYTYNIFLPLRLKNGKYYRVRQESIPFLLDDKGNMVLQMNCFYTGFEPYFSQPMTSYFAHQGPEFTNHFTEVMGQAHRKAIKEEIFAKIPALSPKYKKGWNFKENELKLLRYYRNHPEAKRKEVADKLGYKVHYCNEIWGKIKDKMHRLFAPAHFGSPLQAALFLNQMDIL